MPPLPYLEHLRGAVVDRATIDTFLDPERPSWATFDPITGYRLANFMPRDGIDGCRTISTYASDQARTGHLYAGKPPRIATYGNSFTQCHQVSDGETWQEQLAAHLGEPIRNLGVGGFGVYQAYRRMIVQEQSERAAEYLVLYLWGDDHLRSLLRCRHAAIYRSFDNSGTAFHGNFWANVEMNLDTGELEERPNLLATPESLHRMTDADWMVEALYDDHALRMSLYLQGRIDDLDMPALRALADALGESRAGLDDISPARNAVQRLLDNYSYAATESLLTHAHAFADQHGKQLLIVLFDPFRALEQMVAGLPRCDQRIVDFLREQDLRFFDMNEVHLADFDCFRLSFDDYMMRWFVGRVGHYSPAGNHFFAHALKPMLVDWLTPKPITYEPNDVPPTEFAGYLLGNST